MFWMAWGRGGAIDASCNEREAEVDMDFLFLVWGMDYASWVGKPERGSDGIGMRSVGMERTRKEMENHECWVGVSLAKTSPRDII